MKELIKKHPNESILFIVFIAVTILMSAISPDKFLTAKNLQSMAFQFPEFGILALSMMLVILTGGINLSLTYMASLSGITIALVMSNMTASGMNPVLSIFSGVAAGFVVVVLCGLINSFFVAQLGVSSILATLGTMMLFQGIGQNVTQGRAISGFPVEFNVIGNGSIIGIPIPVIIFALIAFVCWIFIERTPWGVHVYMTGSNDIATNFSGISVKKTLIKVYVLSAVLAFFSVLIMTSRYNSMKVDYGSSYLLQSILAVVLGGTKMSGGYGKVIGTVTAVLTLQVISSGLNIFGLNRFFIDVIMGTLLILVLATNFIILRMGKKLRPAKIKAI